MTNLGGEYDLKAGTTALMREPLISKGSGPFPAILRRGPTLVQGRALPLPAWEPQQPSQRAKNARERRAARGKQERRQRQRDTFSDSAAFAYFMGWPLNMRMTVAWDRCIYGDRDPGHVLGKSDGERAECLRDALRRRLQKVEAAFACIWSRDIGGGHGPHIHLGLHWPLPLEDLAWLLASLTGSRPSSDRLPRGVLARSECRGWQIQANTAREEIPSAVRWTNYLLDQEPRHLIVPKIEGKVLGVSRAIDAKAVAAHRDALEAWKSRMGWVGHEEVPHAL